MEDKEIIELYWQRNEQAISATAKKYSAYCHSIAYNILENHQDSEECVNDTYLKTWKAIPPKRPNVLSAFLAKITRNLSLDLYRKNHRQKRNGGQVSLALDELEQCIPEKISAYAQLDAELLTQLLNGFLKGLSEEKRSVFLKRYWYVMSVREIAQEGSMTQSKVKSMLFNLRKERKRLLESEGFDL